MQPVLDSWIIPNSSIEVKRLVWIGLVRYSSLKTSPGEVAKEFRAIASCKDNHAGHNFIHL